MAGIERVVEGLCEAIGIIHGYVGKRYWRYGEQACRDAIELLKKQQAEIERLKAELGKVVPCKDCDKANVLSDHVICCNPRNTECQSYPLNWFCADGERKDGEQECTGRTCAARLNRKKI